MRAVRPCAENGVQGPQVVRQLRLLVCGGILFRRPPKLANPGCLFAGVSFQEAATSGPLGGPLFGAVSGRPSGGSCTGSSFFLCAIFRLARSGQMATSGCLFAGVSFQEAATSGPLGGPLFGAISGRPSGGSCTGPSFFLCAIFRLAKSGQMATSGCLFAGVSFQEAGHFRPPVRGGILPRSGHIGAPRGPPFRRHSWQAKRR